MPSSAGHERLVPKNIYLKENTQVNPILFSGVGKTPKLNEIFNAQPGEIRKKKL